MKPRRFLKANFVNKEEIEGIRDEINACVNSYFVLCEAADMVLRNAEDLFNCFDEGLKHKVKQRHNDMMAHIKAINNIMDTFFESYECFGSGEEFISKIDMLRNSAAFIARLVLLIGDRSCRDDEKQVMKRIEEYIYYMPEQGLINDKVLNKFKVK